MKDTTKTVTIRMPEDVADWLDEDGKSRNESIVDALQALRKVRQVSMNELAGVFTPNEWKFLADGFNGVMMPDSFRCSVSGLIAHCEDSASLDGLDKKWDVDMEALKQKIRGLHGANVDALYSRIEAFWSNGEADLEEWAKF